MQNLTAHTTVVRAICDDTFALKEVDFDNQYWESWHLFGVEMLTSLRIKQMAVDLGWSNNTFD